MRLLVDTDILIDHIRGARRFEPGPADVCVSAVTRAELYAGRAAEESVVDQLLATFHEIDIDRAIAEQAGRLRRTARLPMPDALIASTALAHGLTLLTRDARRFDRVSGLETRAVVGPGRP